MQNASHSFSVLSAMITPAVLISACGALIFSTSTRLARVVDRVRELSRAIEQYSKDENATSRWRKWGRKIRTARSRMFWNH
jgi:hypothetical protein